LTPHLLEDLPANRYPSCWINPGDREAVGRRRVCHTSAPLERQAVHYSGFNLLLRRAVTRSLFSSLLGLIARFTVVSAAWTLTGSTVSQPVKLERQVYAMGTEYAMNLYGSSVALLESAAEQASDEVKRIDQMLSNYIPDSELNLVNQEAATHPVQVSPEFFGLLAKCFEYSRDSNGAFDITVGPLMKVWGFYKDSGHLPHRAEIRTALNQIGYRSVELDPKRHTVRFRKPGISLDPGGVGKGYAVDRVVAVLRANGVSSALVSAGGSSIYGIGTPPGDPRGWYVRIRDPKDQHKTAAVVYLKNNSLSTSGNYEKFFFAEGKLYSHIMDPRTGYPSEGMLAVSVIAPRTVDSEVWAKPYYILGRSWAVRNKPADFRVLLCEDKPESKCEWLP
jgi:FAD:protein FMN transferase